MQEFARLESENKENEKEKSQELSIFRVKHTNADDDDGKDHTLNEGRGLDQPIRPTGGTIFLKNCVNFCIFRSEIVKTCIFGEKFTFIS